MVTVAQSGHSKRDRLCPSFLERYELAPTYIVSPDPLRSAPGFRNATNRAGKPFLVKHWVRGQGAADETSRTLWTNDVRQLHRIASRPAVAGCFAPLHESGHDANGYYIVLSSGSRLPLQVHLQAPRVPAALRPLPKTKDRLWLWRNLARVARALDALHEHNLVYRNLAHSTILTVGDGEPDFQISGLERSIEIFSPGNECVPRTSQFHPLDDSFAEDWKRFGAIAAGLLLGMDAFKLRDTELRPHDIAPMLTLGEVQLLRELALLDRGSDIDGVRLLSRLEQITTDLERSARGDEGRPVLVVSLGETSGVSATIAAMSGIAIGDVTGQVAFIENDLSHDIGAAAVGKPEQFSLVLRGARLNYHVVDWLEGTHRVPSKWAKAYCQRVSPAHRSPRALDHQSLSSVLFQVMPLERFRHYDSDSARPSSFWSRLRAGLRPQSLEQTEIEIQNQAFLLTQILECLVGVANEFPVEVVGGGVLSSKNAEERFYLRLRVRPDSHRDELSKLVGHQERVGRRLRRALEEEVFTAESWILRPDLGPFDPSNSETRWRPFADEDNDDPTSITFVGDRPVPSIRNAVLLRADASGTQGQLRRRLKALRALREQSELSGMLRDPRERMHRAREFASPLNTNGLDGDKNAALKGILEVVPLYLVQGPPGVGKTRLVSELMKHRFAHRPTEKVLFSAQSHSAIDHLRDEVVKVLPPELKGGPLVVRCRNDDERSTDPHGVSVQLDRMIKAVVDSDLFKQGPPLVKSRLKSLLTTDSDFKGGSPPEDDVSREYYQAPLEDLLLRAANQKVLVCAGPAAYAAAALDLDRHGIGALREKKGSGTRHAMTGTFNTLHEEFRNHLRPYQPQSIVLAAFATLREPAQDKMEGLQRLPWQIMLLVKWALQDELCSDVSGRPISRQEFDELRQRLLEFPEHMGRIGEGFWLSIRRILHQQLAFQRRTSNGWAREAALLGTLPADHPLRTLFLEKTGITPETFPDLSLTTYAAVFDGKLSVPFTWYRDLRSCFPDEVIVSFIRMISRSYPELVTFCRELHGKGEARKASEFYESTPLHRYPFLRATTALECWHPMVFFRGMEGMVHSILSEAGAQYIEPFSKLFERHIASELRNTGCNPLDENALRELVGKNAQVPDGLLSFPGANVFVEAKAGLFDESVMVVGTAAILRNKTRAVQKAIEQGWAAATGMRLNPNTPEQIRNAPMDYLLVVTNRELNASKGTSLKEAYPAGKLEYPSPDAERYLPLERVYVLSVDDFERVRNSRSSLHRSSVLRNSLISSGRAIP